MNGLIPCPWCNEVPNAFENAMGEYVIACQSRKCTVNPSLSYANTFEASGESMAGFAWNYRPPPVTAQAVMPVIDDAMIERAMKEYIECNHHAGRPSMRAALKAALEVKP